MEKKRVTINLKYPVNSNINNNIINDKKLLMKNSFRNDSHTIRTNQGEKGLKYKNNLNKEIINSSSQTIQSMINSIKNNSNAKKEDYSIREIKSKRKQNDTMNEISIIPKNNNWIFKGSNLTSILIKDDEIFSNSQTRYDELSDQQEQNNIDNKELSNLYKNKIEKANINEEIILPSNILNMNNLIITKPIKIKGQLNTILFIKEGPISINFDRSSYSNSVKFSQLQIMYSENSVVEDKKITNLFKLHSGSQLELEDCDIVFQKEKNKPFSSVLNGSIKGTEEKKSVAFLLCNNKKNDKNNNKINPSILKITNSRVLNFYQSIRGGQNCIVSINKSAFMDNYGKAIVMINPLILKVSETYFDNNVDNTIHVKYINECLYEEERKLYFEKNNFESTKGNGICLEGIKDYKIDLSVLISKNNFLNNLTDALLILDLSYDYFSIIGNKFKGNYGNGINIQKIFYNDTSISNAKKYIEPLKIKENQFIENKGFGLFVNDSIIDVESNIFSINRQSGMYLCSLMINEPKKGLDSIPKGSYASTATSEGSSIKTLSSRKICNIIKNNFSENGENGLFIYGYLFPVIIRESFFCNNCRNGIMIDNSLIFSGKNICNFNNKLKQFKESKNEKINELVNVKISKCIIEKNMRSGLSLNTCLVYCEDSFIKDNISYAIYTSKREYQYCFKENKSGNKKNNINGSLGGDWGEIIISSRGQCGGLGCMANPKSEQIRKSDIEKKLPSFPSFDDGNNNFDNYISSCSLNFSNNSHIPTRNRNCMLKNDDISASMRKLKTEREDECIVF